MKKLMMLSLALMLICVATACSSNPQNQIKSTSLYQKGIELTQKMDLLAEDETYLRLLTYNDQIGTLATEIGSQDYSKPKAVYEIAGLEEASFRMVFEQEGATLSPEVQEIVKGRFGAAAVSQINAQGGVELLSATTMLTAQDSFFNSELSQQKTYLYLYDGKYNSMVTFLPYPDHIVMASANFVMQEALAQVTTADEVALLFETQLGLGDLKVSLVTG